MTVHPRASGERHRLAQWHSSTAGSSPRERGTLARQVRWPLHGRFIPARAGNAAVAVAGEACKAVHPRASGERGTKEDGTQTLTGSSPRERGTRTSPLRQQHDQRFIPARAGNAPRSTVPAAAQPVHPRASGERPDRPLDQNGYAGSSPRERGTLDGLLARIGDGRFIPARAGNAYAAPWGWSARAVHPRASGERFFASVRASSHCGSSPRERGTHNH